MATPPEVTTKNLTGVYLHNKALSDSTDEILRLQGVSWFKRKAIANFNLTLYVKHTNGDDGFEHIDIDQRLSGGISGTTENRVMNWEDRHTNDDLFGAVVGKSRRVSLDEIEDEFLKTGWTQDTVDDRAIEALAWSDTPISGKDWRANQIWGFEEKDGARRYARHIKFTSSERSEGPILVHMYYDYQGTNN